MRAGPASNGGQGICSKSNQAAPAGRRLMFPCNTP